jgi:collagenase-like PrtC family protease
MLNFNVGCNFDNELLDKTVVLKKYYGHNINFYGSLKKSFTGLPTARPDFRIPDISLQQAKDYITLCHKCGIKFNYTLNSSLTADWFNNKLMDGMYILLKELNVDIITLSHPIAIDYFGKKDIPIEISTILEVDNINAIQYYCDTFNVEKICLSIRKNRDMKFLEAITRYGLQEKVELLVNEFCTYGGMPCANFNRKACYELHAMEGNKEGLNKGFPMMWCSASRYKDPVSWLKSSVIFPWYLRMYTEIFGITNFKLSGRTLPTEFIVKGLETYLSNGSICPENLLELWGHVDKVGTDNLLKVPSVKISTTKLKQIPFEYHNCDYSICSECGYCEKIFELVKE